jgi:hypothetical protein
MLMDVLHNCPRVILNIDSDDWPESTTGVPPARHTLSKHSCLCLAYTQSTQLIVPLLYLGHHCLSTMDSTVFASPTNTSDMTPASLLTTTMTSTLEDMTRDHEDDDGISGDSKKRTSKAAKRRKVNHACLYCRRSHMTCDEGRPCQRW